MQRQVPKYLAIFLAVMICGPAVWADENPKAAKTGKEVHERVLQVEIAKTDPSDGKKDESAVAVPEATGGDVTVSWRGGQLSFPDTSGKASGLRLRCTGNVIIKGKGVTAKTTDLDVTIEEKGVIPTASNLSLGCTGSVMIEWKGFTAVAPALQFDAERAVLSLSSGGKPNGCILGSKNKDGTNAVLIAEQISLSPSSNRVSCVGVREYRAADGSSIGQFQAALSSPGTVYYPPGAYPAGAYRATVPPPASYGLPTANPPPSVAR